jgi:hypothetical protein
VSTLIHQGYLGHTSVESNFHRKGCKLGKQIQLLYPSSVSHSTKPFNLIHSDVWGLAPFATKGGHKYYVIFVDDYSRYTWIYFMKHRSQLCSIDKSFTRKNLFGTPRYDHLRVFGCTCYVLLAPRERTKLTAQSIECAFMGYSPEHKSYRCYDPSTRRMRISHDVTFVEDRPFFYNSSTHSSSSSTESTSFLYLPPILSSDDAPSSTPPPPANPPQISYPQPPPPRPPPCKPPVTRAYTRRSANNLEPPSSPSTASPDAPGLVDPNTLD